MAAIRPTMFARTTEKGAVEDTPVPVRPAAVQLRARRSPRLILLGILCACLGALVMGWAWSSQADTQSVVLVTRDIPRGEVIGSGDLTTTTLTGASGVSVVPAAEASGLVGQHALTDLQAGGLLGPGTIGVQAVPAGSAQLGLRLTAGRLPSAPLPPGSPVNLIAVPSGTDAEAAPGAEFAATVVSTPQATADGAWVFDVQVDETVAARVAVLAAQDRLAVVRKADG